MKRLPPIAGFVLAGFALAVCALVCVSCSPPPFDLSISQSAQTASRMTLMGQVGPVYNVSSDQSVSDEMFIPEKDSVGGITVQAGFVTWKYQSGPLNYAAVIWDGSQGAYIRYGSIQSTSTAATDKYPAFLIQAVKSLHNVEVFQYDEINPGMNRYTVVLGNPSANAFPFGVPITAPLESLVTTGAFGTNSKQVIGVSTYPDQSQAIDRTYWLFRQTLTNNYLEARFDNSQTGVNPTGSPLRGLTTYDLSVTGSGFLPIGINRVMYYYDPLSVPGRSYACWWDTTVAPNRWRTWVWTDISPTSRVELTNITSRIDALLTTGNLFSTEGEVGRIYDQNGSLLSGFLLGNLKLIGEMYIGGVANVLFSQALHYNRALHFNVYSIPTTQLTSLGQ
jgi:hypothetical protein